MTADAPAMSAVTEALQRLLGEHPPSSSSTNAFLGARYDAGLAWVHFDRGFGGLGLPAHLQRVVTETLDGAGAPGANDNYVGVHQAAAAVHALASDDLRRRWLRPAFTNEEYWCQLFSEPDAGSDLASLSTVAVRDGDEWMVQGQKVWTSFAQTARWGLLLARTDPNRPKHRGLTLFVVDMQADGVEVRPLRTIDGGRHFNELFLTNVRVPDRYRLGEPGQGWTLSQHLLSTEREGVTDNESSSSWLLEAWRRRCPRGPQEALLRDRVIATYVGHQVSQLLTLRAHQYSGTFAPVVKLSRNLIDQATAAVVVDLLGAEGMLGGSYEGQAGGTGPTDQLRFLHSRAATIGGGTAQIMRNLIGERILGLPPEARVDKDMPWIDSCGPLH